MIVELCWNGYNALIILKIKRFTGWHEALKQCRPEGLGDGQIHSITTCQYRAEPENESSIK